jgi:CRISPR/Cas system-associated exonuclease Cas4 (RecB family)
MIEALIQNNESLDMPTTINAGSYTRLSRFETCKNWAKLSYIDKIKEPERPLKEGQTEHANDRGTRLHTAAEMYVKGGVELIPELNKFSIEFQKAKELFADGKASTEGDWAFTRDWEPVAWMSNDVWVRIKCDLVCFMTKDYAVVVDYKSGRRFGNEMKHNEQMQLYTIGTLLKYPKLKKVTTELWYLDQDEIASVTYTRDQGLRFVKNYENRFEKLTTCDDFPPNPNVYNCKWCPYKPERLGGTGHCSVGV